MAFSMSYPAFFLSLTYLRVHVYQGYVKFSFSNHENKSSLSGSLKDMGQYVSLSGPYCRLSCPKLTDFVRVR